MLIFLDTEYTNLQRPDLMSIGMVSADGREFYAELTDYKSFDMSDFVRAEVQPLFGRVPGAACNRWELTDKLRAWFQTFPQPVTVVFDYTWDWQLLAGAMVGLPDMTHAGDFAEQFFLDRHSITHPVFAEAQNRSFTIDWPPHHALADARALKAGYTVWQAYMAKIRRIK